jgi:hypothetical protein
MASQGHLILTTALPRLRLIRFFRIQKIISHGLSIP